MANIRQYENPINGINPGDMGAGASAQAGVYAQRTQGQIGDQIASSFQAAGSVIGKFEAEAQKAKEQSDMVAGIGAWSQAQLDISNSWDSYMRDPANAADPQARQKWMESGYKPIIDKFNGGLEAAGAGPKTLLWAARAQAANQQSTFRATTADVAQASSATLKASLDLSVNNAGVLVNRDPHLLDEQMAAFAENAKQVAALSGGDPGAQAAMVTKATAEANSAFGKQAMAGLIRQSPEAVLHNLDEGLFDEKFAPLIGADGLAAARDDAVKAIKAKSDVISADATAKTKADKVALDRASADIVLSTFGPDGKEGVTGDTYKAIEKYGTMDGVSGPDVITLKNYTDIIRDGANKVKVSDVPTFTRLSKLGADGTLKYLDIARAVVAKQLSPEDDAALKGLIGARAQDAAKSPGEDQSVVGRLMTVELDRYKPVYPTQAGNDIDNEYRSWAMKQYTNGRAAGIPSSELFDRAGPNYVGRGFLPKEPDILKQPTLTFIPSINAPAPTAGLPAPPAQSVDDFFGGAPTPEPAPAPDTQGALTAPDGTTIQLANYTNAVDEPQLVPIRDVIGSAEAPNGYDTVFGNKSVGGQITAMTVASVQEAQKSLVGGGSESSAMGRYQIITPTLNRLVDAGVIAKTDTFDQATQDRAANYLIREAGFNAYQDGKITKDAFADNLAKVWAGLPLANGRSYYKGVGSNNATVSRAASMAALGASQSAGPKAGPSAGAYANVPAKELADFQKWNPDPVGNSQKELGLVAPDLQSVFRTAQVLAKANGITLIVASGRRDAQKQADAVALGWSQTMDSNHAGGRAMDVWALDASGAVTFDPDVSKKVAAIMNRSSSQLGIPVEWGGNWKNPDRPHFQLPGQMAAL